MKNLPLAVIGFALLLQSCGDRMYGRDNQNAEIFGKVTILSETGKDITKYCSANINRYGILRQKAHEGDNAIKQITCTPGSAMYRIKPALTVNVPNDDVAVYFGDIIINLDKDGTYEVERDETTSSGLYAGSLPVQKGALNTGGDKKWVKTYMGLNLL